MKGKIEFLMEDDGTFDGAPCVKLEGVDQSNKVVGAYYYDDRGNKRSLFSGGLELKQLGDDMFYIIPPSSSMVYLIDQRGACGAFYLERPTKLAPGEGDGEIEGERDFERDKKITATADGFIKIEYSRGDEIYIDRLFQKSTRPTELGKALYQYDRENINPEDVIDAYFKGAHKDDPAGVIKNKVMEFILNEEKARAFREIEGMEDVPDEYVKGLEDKIAGIEAYLKLKQEGLKRKEAAKKAISSISFDSNFLTKY